ncbi:hypothetical protein UFOVP45_144 [uncultured Caudovirales phage]|uniref:Uncharacterized protein n=1 Tax=uncultured Caudovirales phage TaxID=2100421 RepID=A0A6J5KSP8_9CAUD|nr:hypothetical protein UFOVP45_144 [uncultured Caudovirales phage]
MSASNQEFGNGTASGRGDAAYSIGSSGSMNLSSRYDGPDGITPGTKSKEFEGN